MKINSKIYSSITSEPFDIQELTLKTEPRGYNKLFAYRDFELHSGDRLLGRMQSMWSIVDIDSRSIVPIQLAISDNPKMAPFQKREDDLSFAKITSVNNPTLIKEFEVRYTCSDLIHISEDCLGLQKLNTWDELKFFIGSLPKKR